MSELENEIKKHKLGKHDLFHIIENLCENFETNVEVIEAISCNIYEQSFTVNTPCKESASFRFDKINSIRETKDGSFIIFLEGINNACIGIIFYKKYFLSGYFERFTRRMGGPLIANFKENDFI
jgi:uncharacterized protein YkuJ